MQSFVNSALCDGHFKVVFCGFENSFAGRRISSKLICVVSEDSILILCVTIRIQRETEKNHLEQIITNICELRKRI
jgi:hypothetical protein